MLKTGSILFIISLILGFKFEIFRIAALVIVILYALIIPYYFLIMKTCRNCGVKNPPFKEICPVCGEKDWKRR
jgi:ribosomal protein L40E